MRARLVGIYIVALVAVLAAANFAASRWTAQGLAPPDYATWTGVLEVERKVRLLREFAAEGDVDALILSSSMGDYGVSAEVLTREMTARKGKPYRVFNFSMGGADLTTYPLVYRFARLVAKPKEVWIISPVSTSPVQGEGGLEDQLLKGPLGRSLRFPTLLEMEYAVRDLALVRNAAAIRDWTIHRAFTNRPRSNLDLYEINKHGDTRSWLYNPVEYENGLKHMERHIDHVMKFVRQPNASEDRKHHVLYFSNRMMHAINDLRTLAAEDGTSITVVPFDSGASLAIKDPAFLAAGMRFYEPLRDYLGARLVDARPAFVPRPYMLTDPIHMNNIGSEQFSKALAAAITGTPAPTHAELVTTERILKSLPDPTWTTFTALVVKRRQDPSGSLRLKYFQNWGLKRLRPFSNQSLAVRLADNTETTLPVRVLEGGEMIADTSNLAFAEVDQIMTAQLVPKGEKMGKGMDLPLVSYEWSAQRYPPAWYEEGVPEVRSASTHLSPIEPIKVSWRNLHDPMKFDWIGLFPVGGDGRSRMSFSFTNGLESGSFELPPAGRAGEFELRMFRNNAWESIAESPPIRVTDPKGQVAISPARVAVGEPMVVTWRDLNHPHEKDWVGLFARGTNDDARLDVRYLGGAREGRLEWVVTPAFSPGEYEIRLFSAGGWTKLSTSTGFSIVAAPAAGK